MVPAVDGFVQTASRRIVGIANRPWRTSRCPHISVDSFRVGWVECEIDGPGVLVFVENLLECLPTVGGPEDASFSIRSIGMPQHGDIDAIGVLRIDQNRSDLLTVAETQMCPGLAAIA